MPQFSEPFSVPDDLADGWDDMVRRNRLIQTLNDPDFADDGDGPAAAPHDLAGQLRQAQMPMADWLSLRSDQLAQASPSTVVDKGGDETISGAGGSDRLEGATGNDTVTGGASATVDPSRTDVFQRGVDGKLHPIPGWHTTGLSISGPGRTMSTGAAWRAISPTSPRGQSAG